ncbi:hypothetical protein [Halocalculus aciditolerans]|uniref:Uncharacterized protein n=1 Tax=Halocalculus aciditolerans TaxID=1383812 RepID=A0A830FIZ7_9EURY|nr:hypothetical protein [Halocalculus aciditolerans]GGL57472.1 hypothetical protein GCM10009039_14560 [Halocalculus aciditolerans]
MSKSRQPTLSELATDEPEIGVSIDVEASYAHVRYAALDEPGVIWFDPRDGREYLAVNIDPERSELSVDERVVTSVRLRAKHGRGPEVDPDGEWVARVGYATLEEYERTGLETGTGIRKKNVEASEVFEGVHSAREWCRETVPAYATAEYRDAVAARVEGVSAGE